MNLITKQMPSGDPQEEDRRMAMDGRSGGGMRRPGRKRTMRGQKKQKKKKSRRRWQKK